MGPSYRDYRGQSKENTARVPLCYYAGTHQAEITLAHGDLGKTVLPVPRLTMQVHHRDDHVLIRHDPKNNAERERHRETTTNAVFDF